jgi:hypothetical protein
MNVRKCSLAVVLLFALAVFLPGSALASGIPLGWTCAGSCGQAGADGVVPTSPYGSSEYQFVSTFGGSVGVGVVPVPPVQGNETDGSTLATNVFSANAGDSLNFYFDYVTSDGSGFPDYAWAELFDSSKTPVALIFTAQTEPAPISIVPGLSLALPVGTLTPSSVAIQPGTTWSPLGSSSGLCWASGCGNSGWVNASYTIPTAGSYYLEIGVVNANDQIYDSGLAMDGVIVGGKPITTTPEPGTLALLGTFLVLAARRRRAS